MSNYRICRLQESEMSIIIDWMKAEGWNPGINDDQCFFAADHNGFFAGKLDDKIIAVASAVIYDDSFAFCGCYIVKPEYRHKGYGIALTKARLEYVANRITGLDGVLDMVDQYAKIGYKFAHNNLRFSLNNFIKSEINENIVSINQILIDDLFLYDKKYFPAPRYNFLKIWCQQNSAQTFVYRENNEIMGYAVIRKCFQGYKIGPLFAEKPEVAEALFLACVNNKTKFPIMMDIPKPNSNAVALVEKYRLELVFETNRMYRCGIPDLNLNNIYGITTFELG